MRTLILEIDVYKRQMYLDAGEYHLYQTGNDIRAFFVSMYGLSVKFSQAVSAALVGLILGSVSYKAGMVLDTAGKTRFSWMLGLTMAIGYGPVSYTHLDVYKRQI